jgi:hypothetical protein
VRTDIRHTNTTAALLSDRITTECFTAMREPGQCLRAMGEDAEVANFAVREDEKGDRRTGT